MQTTKQSAVRIHVSLFTLIVLSWPIQPVGAAPILGEPILGGQLLVAEDGYVTAEFLGADARYFSTLSLDSPGSGDFRLFDKATSLEQEPISLGWYLAGTELIFRLDVRNTAQRFFTGGPNRNPDGLAHALAITVLNDAGVYLTTVGFEDLFGGGDNDFNDFMFRLTNVIDPPAVPAPPVVALFGLGLVGLIHTWRKQTKV